MRRHQRPLRARAQRPSVIAVVALVGMSAAGCGVPAEGGNLGELRGWVMDTPIPKPDLTLTDTNGEEFDLRAETDGYLTLVFFGYTYCPDICPVHMANLGAVFGELRPEVRDRTKVVFLTTDPERDTPERLRSWLDNFDRAFVGLRGSLDDINAALSSMLLPGVAIFPGEHGSEPLIGHPAAVLAFSPDGLARVRYPFGVRQADWAHDLPLLVQGL
jgi:protein SCO1/2